MLRGIIFAAVATKRLPFATQREHDRYKRASVIVHADIRIGSYDHAGLNALASKHLTSRKQTL